MRLALVYLMCPCLQPNQVGHVVTNASGFHQLACALVKQKGDLTIYTNVFLSGACNSFVQLVIILKKKEQRWVITSRLRRLTVLVCPVRMALHHPREQQICSLCGRPVVGSPRIS